MLTGFCYGELVFFEPTSEGKATAPFVAGVAPLVTFAKPNAGELRAMAGALLQADLSAQPLDDLALVRRWAALVARTIPNLFVSLGAHGMLVPRHYTPLHGPAGAVGSGASQGDDGFVHVAPPPLARVVDATGAGDSFVGAFLAAWVRGDLGWPACVHAGLSAARLTLQSPLPVAPALTPALLDDAKRDTARA